MELRRSGAADMGDAEAAMRLPPGLRTSVDTQMIVEVRDYGL